MKKFEFNVIKFDNDDVIATSGNDVDFSIYTHFTYIDPDAESESGFGKLYFYQYNPGTGKFDYQSWGAALSEMPKSYAHHDSEQNYMQICEHPETHIFSGGPLDND